MNGLKNNKTPFTEVPTKDPVEELKDYMDKVTQIAGDKNLYYGVYPTEPNTMTLILYMKRDDTYYMCALIYFEDALRFIRNINYNMKLVFEALATSMKDALVMIRV